MPTFTYTVDAEQLTTEQHELTPRQILDKAGLSPAVYYLEIKDGNHTASYKDKLDTPIHMHEGMTFISIKMGPTPLSSAVDSRLGTHHVP